MRSTRNRCDRRVASQHDVPGRPARAVGGPAVPSGAAQMWHGQGLFVDDAATCSNSSLAGRRLLPRTRVGGLIPIMGIDAYKG